METGYTNLKNEELVAQYKLTKDQRVFEEIMSRTERLRVFFANKYLNIPGSELEDLLIEGSIALMEAINNFDASVGAAFTTFLYFHLTRYYDRIFVKLSHAKRNVNVEVKVHSYIDNLDNDSYSDGTGSDRDYIRGKDYFSVECEEFDMVEMEAVIERLKLSEQERVVVNFLIAGYSKPEIAKYLGVQVPSVHSYVKRVGNKLKNSLAYA